MKTLGIYITDDVIRMGLLNDADKQPAVKEYRATSATLKATLKKNNILPERVVLYIPRTIVSLRYLRIPAVNDAEVDQMVAFEQAASFPFKPEELVLGHAIVSKSKDGYSTVMLAAVQKDMIMHMIAMVRSAGLAPDEVSISSISVFNQLRNSGKTRNNALVVNTDDGFADVLFIKDNTLAFSRAISRNDLEREIDQTVRILQETGQSIDAVVRDSAVPVIHGLTVPNALVIDLLPQELKARKVRELRKRSLVYMVTLIALNLAIIANIVFMRVKAQDAYMHMLKKETAKIEDDAQAVQKKMRKAQILLESSASGKVVLGLLSELYRTAPAGVVLSSLDISGKSPLGAILLVGQAPASESVLKFVNAMKTGGFIRKTEVNYITKRAMAAGQMVDFEIRAGF